MALSVLALMVAAGAFQASPEIPAVRARGNIGELFSEEDYPPEAWQARQEGSVRFAYDVAPDGRVTGCTIIRSSGSPALDEGTCRLMTERARLTPARDAQGRAVADRLTANVGWQLPDELPAEPMADLADYLTGADYPAEALQRGEQGRVHIAVLVSQEGRVTDCGITQPSGSHALDLATCRAIRERARFLPARDEERQPARGGALASVEWRIVNGVGTVGAPPPLALNARARANLASYVRDNDYPRTALARDEQGRVLFVLHVSPQGRVSDCAVISSSGSPTLDGQTCAIMRNRARFEPARDAQGNPAPDRVMSSITWRIYN